MGSAPGEGSPQPKVIGHTVLRPRQQVERTIKAAILSGELKRGEMLPPEAELASQFNVSRGTLREALRSLVSQRLIYKVPGARGGNFVQSVDYRALGDAVVDSVSNLLALGSLKFEEVAQVRQMIEVPSVRLAAEHREEAHLEGLREIVKKQKVASVSDPEIPELDRQFHALIAEASGNRVLASLVAALHHVTEPVHYLDLSPEVGVETVKQHQAIVKAIEAQDPEAGERAIVKHLTYLRHHLNAHRAAEAST